VLLSAGEATEKPSPTALGLLQNYPNPFNITTKINYRVTEPGLVQLKIVDLLGTEVASLVNGRMPAGDYSFEWNATGCVSGIYFCKLQINTYDEVKKMVLIK
jgi:hypothetical protein